MYKIQPIITGRKEKSMVKQTAVHETAQSKIISIDQALRMMKGKGHNTIIITVDGDEKARIEDVEIKKNKDARAVEETIEGWDDISKHKIKRISFIYDTEYKLPLAQFDLI